MEFQNIESLENYVSDIDSFLKNEMNHHEVDYSCVGNSGWNVELINKANDELLTKVSGSANIYALFIAQLNSSKYELKYIGKTTQKLARQRLRNHLIHKHAKTGAKLNNVRSAIEKGAKCKIAFISLKPESLRNYVEEELINRNSNSTWNRENA